MRALIIDDCEFPGSLRISCVRSDTAPRATTLVTILHNPSMPSPFTIVGRRTNCGVQIVDSVTRTRQRQKLMVELLERKIRLRARQLYDERGQVEGLELEDWVQAESEVLLSSILAPLWNKRQQRELAEI